VINRIWALHSHVANGQGGEIHTRKVLTIMHAYFPIFSSFFLVWPRLIWRLWPTQVRMHPIAQGDWKIKPVRFLGDFWLLKWACAASVRGGWMDRNGSAVDECSENCCIAQTSPGLGCCHGNAGSNTDMLWGGVQPRSFFIELFFRFSLTWFLRRPLQRSVPGSLSFYISHCTHCGPTVHQQYLSHRATSLENQNPDS
jgi:hypothetical protein